MVEGIRQHQHVSKEAARKQAISLLQEVKLLPKDDELQSLIEAEHPDWDTAAVQAEIAQRKQAILNPLSP